MGHIYITEEKYKEATDILKKGRDLAMKLGRNFALLQNNLGFSYYHLRQYDKAIKMFDEAIKIDPGLVEAWYNRALVYEEMGDADNYRRDIEQAYKINPKYKDLKSRINQAA